jgi:hypothetical protein
MFASFVIVAFYFTESSSSCTQELAVNLRSRANIW